MNFLISDNENQWMCKELDASLSLHVVSRICLFWPYFWACELVDRCFSIESCCLQRAVTIRLILQVRGFFVQGKKSCRVVDHFFCVCVQSCDVVFQWGENTGWHVQVVFFLWPYGIHSTSHIVNTQSIRYASLAQHFWLLQGDGKLSLSDVLCFEHSVCFFFILTIKKYLFQKSTYF